MQLFTSIKGKINSSSRQFSWCTWHICNGEVVPLWCSKHSKRNIFLLRYSFGNSLLKNSTPWLNYLSQLSNPHHFVIFLLANVPHINQIEPIWFIHESPNLSNWRASFWIVARKGVACNFRRKSDPRLDIELKNAWVLLMPKRCWWC